MCGGTPSTSHVVETRIGLSPRVRGTHIIPPGRCPWRGLSPRVRGNRSWWLSRRVSGGSIPACAGEPASARGSGGGGAVYPRVCGGTSQHPCPPSCYQGLSPRVRGNPAGPGPAHPGRRSIPACAGEPGCAWWRPCWIPVYPRVCGGTETPDRKALNDMGLSPRVRGNLCHARGGGRNRGSIPACAGEPTMNSHYARIARVYPRVCGGTPWPFDSAPYHPIRQRNNVDPLPTIYQTRPLRVKVFIGPLCPAPISASPAALRRGDGQNMGYNDPAQPPPPALPQQPQEPTPMSNRPAPTLLGHIARITPSAARMSPPTPSPSSWNALRLPAAPSPISSAPENRRLRR